MGIFTTHSFLFIIIALEMLAQRKFLVGKF